MKLQRYILVVLGTWLFFVQTQAQQKATISGYVEDKSTGEKLIGANVYDARTLVGTVSNAYGFFSLTLPTTDSLTLAVSFMGYKVYSRDVLLTESFSETIALTPNLLLNEIEVKASTSSEKIQEQSQMSSINVPIQQIKSLPTFLGEVDVLKALQLLPGVQSGSEGSSGLYVRGGGPDQNLILLDGVPVYNVSHLFGFFSVFNADAISNVNLIKGGFPARYGGRLSSVIDISMKEGNNQKLSGAASLGIIASKLTLEGPLWKNKTSFIVSGRRTYIDVLARPIMLAASAKASAEDPEYDARFYGGYYFYDLNVKLNHKISTKDRLFLSAYWGDDAFYVNAKETYSSSTEAISYSDEYKANLGWGNLVALLRWNHIINQKMFSNVSVYHSRYNLGTKVGFSSEYESPFEENQSSNQSLSYFSGIYDWSGKIDFDYMPNPNHYVRFGTGVINHTFRPGAIQVNYAVDEEAIDTLIEQNFTKANELSLYIEDDMKIGKRLKANIGVHLSGFDLKDEFYYSIQPRISARYMLNSDWSVKGSYAQMTQYVHLLTNSNALDLPTDLWVPATGLVAPQQSYQWAAGVAHTLNNNFEVSLEGYYKLMNNLIAYKDGEGYLAGTIGGTTDWQDKVESGRGTSYGMEFLVQKKMGKTTGWVGYTLSWTDRTFEVINFGDSFPYKYDRRHDLAITAVHRFNKKWEISANWVFGTGNAVTLPLANYPRADMPTTAETTENPWDSYYDMPFGWGPVEYYNKRNGYRMRNYHRLDFGASYIKKYQKIGEGRFNLGVYNAYSRKNPFFMFQDNVYDPVTGVTEPVFKQISLFPILPALSYNHKF